MSTSPFVGRTAEMSCLRRYLAEALSGQPRLVFVSGEAGIGKTRLIEEFVAEAIAANPEEEGIEDLLGGSQEVAVTRTALDEPWIAGTADSWRTRLEELVAKRDAPEPELVSATGECNSHFGHASPLHPFRAVFEELFVGRDNKVRSTSAQRLLKIAALIADFAPEVAGIFFPLAPVTFKAAKMTAEAVFRKSPHVEDEPNSHTMFIEQLNRVFLWAAQQVPLLIVLEDLHWADESSIELLFHMVRSWEAQRLMIIGTYRPEEASVEGSDHPLLWVERELIPDRRFQRIKLGWLEKACLRAWLDELYPLNQFPDIFVKSLHERTEGNALFVEEVLKDLQERGLIYQSPEGLWLLKPEVENKDTLPESIAAVLDQRLMRLERQFRDMLTCASVEGAEFTAQVVAAVRRLDEDQVIDSLIEVLDRQMALVSNKGDRLTAQQQWLDLFEFRHSSMQKHLYENLAPPQKRRLHRKIGEHLETLYQGMAQEAPALNRHFEGAKRADKAFQYAVLAAEYAQGTYDYEAVRKWYKKALSYLPAAHTTPQVEADVWHGLGRCEVCIGSFTEAEVCYRRALDILQLTEDEGRRADVLVDLGYCHIQTGRCKEAINTLESALALNQKRRRPTEEAFSMLRLAFAHHKDARQDLAREYLMRAGAKFDDLGDKAGSAIAHRHLGIHYRITGDFERSVRHLENAVRLDLEAEDKFHAASDYSNLGSTYLFLRNDDAKALAYYQDSLKLSREISKVHEAGHALLNIARLHILRGNWPLALLSVEEGMQLSETAQQTSNVIRGLGYRGIIRFFQGQLDEALQDYQNALNVGELETRMRWAVLYNLGTLQMEAGRLDEALDSYREAARLLITIAEQLPADERELFFRSQQKTHAFRALLFTARSLGKREAADTLLDLLPDGVSVDTSDSPPRFVLGEQWI